MFDFGIIDVDVLSEQFAEEFPKGIASVDEGHVYSSIPIICDSAGTFSIPVRTIYTITSGDTQAWGQTGLIQTNLDEKRKMDNEQSLIAYAHGYELLLWTAIEDDGISDLVELWQRATARMWFALAGRILIGRQKRFFEHPISPFAISSISQVGEANAGGRAVAPSDARFHAFDVPFVLGKGGSFGIEIGAECEDALNTIVPQGTAMLPDPPAVNSGVWMLRHHFVGLSVTEVK